MNHSEQWLYERAARTHGEQVAATARAMLRAIDAPMDDDVAWIVAIVHARVFIAQIAAARL